MRKVKEDDCHSYWQIAYTNRHKAMDAGGTWVPEEKLWKIPKSREFLLTGMRDILVPCSNAPKLLLDGYKFAHPLPYKHQLETLDKAVKAKKFGLFLEMGLGKTRIMVDAMNIIGGTQSIVFTVKSMVRTWADEISKWSLDRLKPIVVEGSSSMKRQALRKTDDRRVYVTNYETLISNREDLEAKDKEGMSVIVLDESQKIKSHSTRRTKALIGKDAMFVGVPYRFILTGTPIGNGALDLYPQIRFLGREFMPFSSFYAFRNKFAKMGGYMNYQVIGYKDIGELEELMRRCSISLRKEDCLDLPPKIYEVRRLEMVGEIARQYKQMKEELIIEFNGQAVTAPIALVKLLRLSAITAGAYCDKDNVKLDELEDIIDDYGVGVVVWCRFIETIRKIEERIGKKKRVATFFGETKSEDRLRIVGAFQSGEIDVFIGQISAGGVGITLTKASLVIYYENSFSYTDRIQSEDRTHRIGTTRPCTYIDLVYEGTIDEKVLKCLKDKRSFADGIINDIKTII